MIDLLLTGARTHPTGPNAHSEPRTPNAPDNDNGPPPAATPTAAPSHEPQPQQSPAPEPQHEHESESEHTPTPGHEGTSEPEPAPEAGPGFLPDPDPDPDPEPDPDPDPEFTAEPAPRPGGLGPPLGVDVVVIATLNDLAAAYPDPDPTTGTTGTGTTGAGTGAGSGGGPGTGLAGLARVSLGGPTATTGAATLTPHTLARLTCDSPIRRLLVTEHGAVLHHGRARRLASRAQRRALTIRDAGCVIPGCTAPPEWTEIHHLTPWHHGGLTDLDAMVLLCPRHHTAHHAGHYPLRITHGVPWVQLPAWQNITRPWARNTTHHTHHTLANTTAHHLTRRPPPPWEQQPPNAA